METFKDRLVKERDELREKLDKLGVFVFENPKFKELDSINQKLLYRQWETMVMYRDILEERLNLLK